MNGVYTKPGSDAQPAVDVRPSHHCGGEGAGDAAGVVVMLRCEVGRAKGDPVRDGRERRAPCGR